ncbi:aromatic alcohol reductase [Chryseobacterium viscerum]|uniref:Aromatic alcohol reductase n=1 Tax=Chryseobacterium viscerum TaxID=1037377 RepID=A0A316WA06_9FLAO|nr:aromatic alcohol reductase [Chryseobacterium viscerum]PWN58144.1 aromatic alcohol reductase [Chryseobacterium viscerum]
MKNISILVLGAGELGMPVIRNLSKKAKNYSNIRVTVLLRESTINSEDADKKKNITELKELGVELLPGDLASPSSELVSIFKNYDSIVSCTGYGSGAGGFQLKLANAVLDAGVKRYFPWQFGVDFEVIGRGSAQDLFDEQLDVRELLRSQSETKWVIVSTGMFTSYLFQPFFGVLDLEKKSINAIGGWDIALTVTTPEDIGKLTAEIFFTEPQIENEIVYIGGDTITYGQLADIAESLSGQKFERTLSDMTEIQRDLKNDPSNFVKKYRSIFGAGQGVSWELEKTFNFQNGIKTTSAEQWAKDNIDRNLVINKN